MEMFQGIVAEYNTEANSQYNTDFGEFASVQYISNDMCLRKCVILLLQCLT